MVVTGMSPIKTMHGAIVEWQGAHMFRMNGIARCHGWQGAHMSVIWVCRVESLKAPSTSSNVKKLIGSPYKRRVTCQSTS
jgi:hypothetical protein